MGNCKDCRHYKDVDLFYTKVGKCGLLQRSSSGVVGRHSPDMTIDITFTAYVRQTFGCVYFEEREKEIHEHVRLGDHWFCIYLSEDEDRHTIRFVDNCDRELGRIENVRFPCDCCS